MATKQALIVDDSRTAQVRLRKLLENYDLVVDTADSAEEALTYLSDKLPAVVFMDHLMPGMDGFEALKAIKSNPDTAMVPIIMYTSKSGDVYVGQARALGAIDVLSKDIIGVGDLEKMLANLQIIPLHAEENSAGSTVPRLSVVNSPSRSVPSAALSVNQKIELHKEIESLKDQILHLFQNRVQDLKEEFSEHYRQLTRLIQNGFHRQTQKPLEAISEETALFVMFERQIKGTRRMMLMLGLLVLGAAALLAFWLYKTHQDQALIAQRIVETVEGQYASIARENAQLVKNLTNGGAKTDVDISILASTIAWAINLDGQFGFGRPAIGEKQYAMITELVNRLSLANFVGKIFVDIHHGNYCVVSGTDGSWALPPPDSAFVDCKLLSTLALNIPAWSQHSRPFTNFLTSSPLLQSDKIRLEIELHGFGNPRYPHALTAEKTAGEWNNIAAMNNRVSIAVLPVDLDK